VGHTGEDIVMGTPSHRQFAQELARYGWPYNYMRDQQL
jgi:hypothetical protein